MPRAQKKSRLHGCEPEEAFACGWLGKMSPRVRSDGNFTLFLYFIAFFQRRPRPKASGFLTKHRVTVPEWGILFVSAVEN